VCRSFENDHKQPGPDKGYFEERKGMEDGANAMKAILRGIAGTKKD
jgi:hypothetical protein